MNLDLVAVPSLPWAAPPVSTPDRSRRDVLIARTLGLGTPPQRVLPLD
jgi:hypothetical protein